MNFLKLMRYPALLLFVSAICFAQPSIEYTRFFGGTFSEGGASVAVDSHGHIFLTGETWSPNLPVLSPIQSYKGSGDAYIAKFDSAGQLLFSTFFGGTDYDRGHEIVVDADDNIYIAGWTYSADLPLRNAVQSQYAGDTDAFVAKFSAQGQLVFSSYLGGEGYEEGKTLAIDSARNIIVAGRTTSGNYPLTEGAVDEQAASMEGFITKIASAGSRMIFSTYLGGSLDDVVRGMATGSNGQVYVVGDTTSFDFPVKNAFDSEHGGSADAFVTAFSPSGAVLFSTYIGGERLDRAWGVSVAPHGSLLVVGETRSRAFPVRDAMQPQRAGSQDAFLCRLSPRGTLQLSTYLGGEGNDIAYGVDVGRPSGLIAITGRTASRNFPGNALGQHYRGKGDGYVAAIRPDGMQVLFSSYIGGAKLDTAWGVQVQPSHIVFGGRTQSAAFPNQRSLNRFSGASDAFLASILID